MTLRAVPTAAQGRRLFLGLGLSLIVVGLDQLAKWAVRGMLDVPGASRTLLPILDLTMVWNRGISYSLGASLGEGGPLVFIVLSTVIVAVLIGWMVKGKGAWTLAALGLIVGGAIGNLIDRVRFAAVEDFIFFHVGSFSAFGVFNTADSAISVGAVILVCESLFAKPTSLKNTP